MWSSSAFAVSSRSQQRVGGSEFSSCCRLWEGQGFSLLASCILRMKCWADCLFLSWTHLCWESWDKRGNLLFSLLLVEQWCWSQHFMEIYALVERQSEVESCLCWFLFCYFNLLFSERIELVLPFFLSLLCLLMLLFSAFCTVCR